MQITVFNGRGTSVVVARRDLLQAVAREVPGVTFDGYQRGNPGTFSVTLALAEPQPLILRVDEPEPFVAGLRAGWALTHARLSRQLTVADIANHRLTVG